MHADRHQRSRAGPSFRGGRTPTFVSKRPRCDHVRGRGPGEDSLCGVADYALALSIFPPLADEPGPGVNFSLEVLLTGSGYTVTNLERRVSHMYYGIGLGGLIVIVIILLVLF